MPPIIDEYFTRYQDVIRPLIKDLTTHQEAFVAWPSEHGSELLQQARDTLEAAQHDLFGAFCDDLIERYADDTFPTALIDYLYSGDHDVTDPESWAQIERRASLFASPSGQGVELHHNTHSP